MGWIGEALLGNPVGGDSMCSYHRIDANHRVSKTVIKLLYQSQKHSLSQFLLLLLSLCRRMRWSFTTFWQETRYVSPSILWTTAYSGRYRTHVSFIVCTLKSSVYPHVLFYRFGVVVTFTTASYLQQGVENATTSARQGVDDSQRFLKSTSAEANHLLNQNYDELNSHLTLMLKGILSGFLLKWINR